MKRALLSLAFLFPLVATAQPGAEEMDTAPTPETVAEAKARELILNCDEMREDDLISLACNLYYEARGEGDAGMLAVAAVTMNRVLAKQYPDTIHEVVWHKTFVSKANDGEGAWFGQFSWTLDGRSDRVYDEKAWKRAVELAALTIVDYTIQRVEDPTGGSLHYHHTSVNPYWAPKLLERGYSTVQVGTHIFYRKGDVES